MKLQSHYAVLVSTNVPRAAEFYCEHLGFKPSFASDWYVSLLTPGVPGFELAIVQAGHPSIPAPLDGPTRNLILNFEVEDIGPVHDCLIRGHRLPLLLELRDEPWGQRHFITRDPDGVLLDIIQVIPPSEDFLRNYNPPNGTTDQPHETIRPPSCRP